MKSIIFRYPRFAIKSYGKEKRYLCPPPHLLMLGKAWDADFAEANHPDSGKSSSECCKNDETPDYNNYHQVSGDYSGSQGYNYQDNNNNNSLGNGSHKILKNAIDQRIYSVISIPGVDLLDSGNIEFDENVILFF